MFKNVPTYKPSNLMKRSNEDSNYRRTTPMRGGHVGPTGEPAIDGVISSIYSNVPVYEFYFNGVIVMRRIEDGWINATHILKAADIDKGRRSRLLDKELQDDPFEKVQGGYGRYQGTW